MFIEISGCYDRYNAPMARTICLGDPTPEIDKCAKLPSKAFRQHWTR